MGRKALLNASIIVFWVPRVLPDMPVFTTNVEFGYWLHTGKVLYGRPEGAKKTKYLDWLYKTDTNKEPSTSLEGLLESAVNFANQISNDSEILKKVVPCSMLCSTCARCKYGAISLHARELL